MIYIFPTETCYGLGCSAFDIKGIKRIYKIKKRDKNKPLLVLVSDFKMWKKIAKVNKIALRLAKKYWPGALTIITEKKKIIPDILSKEGIAVRYSSNKIANILIKELKAPLIATSANLSGQKENYSVKEIPDKIKKKVNLIINIGKLKKNLPSTIVDTRNNKIEIVRKGKILPQ